MPARNRGATAADVPVHAIIAMVSDPRKYGAMIEQFAQAEAAAKHEQGVARDRLNECGDAENAVKAREASVTEIETRQDKREADLNTRVARLVAAEQNVTERGRALDVRQTALDEREAAINQSSAALKAAAKGVVEA